MPGTSNLQIVIPVYNDWESVKKLLPLIDEQLLKAGVVADVLLTDDGSSQSPPTTWKVVGNNIETLRILRLRRNLGHQRAICISLCYLRNESNCSRVIVMDGDGEDEPADIPRLLCTLESSLHAHIVFAERQKRSEGWVFSFFYAIYRLLHLVLVGHRVRVGNFSVMNRECMESLSTSSELWNHFAAAAFATRQPMEFVPTKRGLRLAGKSKMTLPSLVMHGLGALSVFSDRISTRLLIVSSFACVSILVAIAAMALVHMTTSYSIPGWLAMTSGIFALFLVQNATLMFIFCFLILFARGSGHFIPARDYEYFVLRIDEVRNTGSFRHREFKAPEAAQ